MIPIATYIATVLGVYVRSGCNYSHDFYLHHHHRQFNSFVGKQKHWEDMVASMFQEGVKPGEETRMPMVPFPVPSLPPTMISCSCIKISYFLRVIYPFSAHLAEFLKYLMFFFIFDGCHLLLCQHFPLSQTSRRCSSWNDSPSLHLG